MEDRLKMEDTNKTKDGFDDEINAACERMKEMTSKFVEKASELKDKMKEMEKKSVELGAEAIKIISEEAQKISENIPDEDSEEAQQKMVEGMMLMALGATSFFGKVIKKGINLTDLGIEVTIKKKDEQPEGASEGDSTGASKGASEGDSTGASEGDSTGASTGASGGDSTGASTDKDSCSTAEEKVLPKETCCDGHSCEDLAGPYSSNKVCVDDLCML